MDQPRHLSPDRVAGDRRILGELQRNAAVSIEALAERVHLSRNACWRRVKQLEERQVLRQRVALVDPEAVDLGLLVFALIRTNEHEPGWLETFKRAVQDMREIVGAHRMSGDLDYVLRVRVKDVKDYDRFYQQLIRNSDEL